MTAQVIEFQPQQDDLRAKALTLPEQARDIIITNQPTYELAAEKLLAVAARRRIITEYHAPLKAKAHEAHAAICKAERSLLAPIEEAESILKREIGAYQMEQQRIQEAREREAREAAEAAAAEALEQSLIAAEAEGASVEEVAAMIAQPMPSPVVRYAPAIQPVSGISSAKVYKAEVYNLKELCRAIGAGEAPISYVAANMTALNGMARSTRGAVKIPGVRIMEDVQVRTGRR